MRVVSFNANGIRASARKGFFDWLKKKDPDLICWQETKAHPEQLGDDFFCSGYVHRFHSAEKKGYSGVAIYTKKTPLSWHDQIGLDWFDREGRWLEARYPKFSVISIYLPSGSSSKDRQALKYQAMDYLTPILKKMIEDEREYILCGDWNIAHQTIDIKNWRANLDSSGFLPQERAWLDHLFYEQGWIDAFRVLHPEPDQYSWWSYRGRARQNNTGWRIDYQIISPGLKDKLIRAESPRLPQFSDHAPLLIDYAYEF